MNDAIIYSFEVMDALNDGYEVLLIKRHKLVRDQNIYCREMTMMPYNVITNIIDKAEYDEDYIFVRLGKPEEVSDDEEKNEETEGDENEEQLAE